MGMEKEEVIIRKTQNRKGGKEGAGQRVHRVENITYIADAR